MTPMRALQYALAAMVLTLPLLTAAHSAVTISTDATRNENCSGGVCTPTDKSANLNVSDLQTMLAASDVTVTTGAGAVAIGVASPLTWASTHRLTLDSIQFIHIKAAVVVEGTAALTLTTNDGGAGGDLVFEDGGTVNFWDLSSSLIVNGASYTLVNDVKTLAGDIATNPSGNYALANEYNASVDGKYPNAPIPRFSGIFEGLNNAIDNIQIASDTPNVGVGLFGSLAAAGTVRDINLWNAEVSGRRRYDSTGILVGDNAGTIIGANVGGTVSGHDYTRDIFTAIGGLVGGSAGTITRSSSAAAVAGNGVGLFIGGLVGSNGGSITLSRATGAVTGGIVTGGLVGFEDYGFIDQSFATGTVSTLNGGTAGGLIGTAPGYSGKNVIRQSYATGDVRVPGSQGVAGGLVGEYDKGSASKAIISQSYATGAVSNIQWSGGFIGSDENGQYISCYWDITTTGKENGFGSGSRPGVTGLTDAQLRTTLPRGFHPAVWGQDPNLNNGRPYLLANPPQ